MSNVAWFGADIENSDRWIYRLTEDNIAELEQALEEAKSRGVTLAELKRDDFPLPGLGPRLEQMLDEIENGLGLCPSSKHSGLLSLFFNGGSGSSCFSLGHVDRAGRELILDSLNSQDQSVIDLSQDRKHPCGPTPPGHSKLESTVRYLGVEVEDALYIAEQIEV